MTIAYDLRYASEHFIGIGTYAFGVLDAMRACLREERIVVLWDPRQDPGRFRFGALRGDPRVEWVERPYAPLSLASLLQVGAWLRQARPSVYFSPFHFMPVRPDCPCVVTIHDVRPLRMPAGLSPWRLALYRWTVERAARARLIATVSEFSRHEIQRLLPAADARVRAILPGIQSGLLSRDARRPSSMPEGPFALVVGDNRPHKNLATLAGAWARLGDVPALGLVGVGPVDPRYPSLAQYAGRAGARNVVHLGHVSDEELSWLYRNAAMLLFPSLYEGFGSPVAEALQLGLPVLASDIPAVRELSAGAVSLIGEGSPDRWADEVQKLWRSPERRERLAQAGRRRAAELTYDRTAAGILDLLREAARAEPR